MAAIPVMSTQQLASNQVDMQNQSFGKMGAVQSLSKVLSASARGEAGDADKNTAISNMSEQLKKAGGSDEECDALVRALQDTGTTGKVQDDDKATVKDAMDKIAGGIDKQMAQPGLPKKADSPRDMI